MEQTNRFNLPDPVVTVLTRDDYSRGESHISVTQLIDSPRVRIMRAEFDHAITEDVSENLWSVLGRAAHSLLEGDDLSDKYESENRYFMDVGGWKLSGAVDLIEHVGPGKVKLYDYKVTSVWSVIFGKDDWHRQLNVYAWLIEEQVGYEVEELEIIVICRDWVSSKARMDESYPQCPIVRYPIPLWSKDKRDQYVHDRMQLHQDAEFAHITGEDLPHCTPEERWSKATKYAVMQNQKKRALKLHDDLIAAQSHADGVDGGWVQERPGAVTRCEQNWCRVAPWCDQYQEEKEHG